MQIVNKTQCFFFLLIGIYTLSITNLNAKNTKRYSFLEVKDSIKEVTHKELSFADKRVALFLNIVNSNDERLLERSIAEIELKWQESDEIMLIESIYYTQNKVVGKKLLDLLQRKTNKKYGYDFDKWFQWLWNKNEKYKDAYFEFKAKLHSLLDRKFRVYFENRATQSTIRLDEVRWGGVKQDGIPPLRNPEMIAAEDAKYLRDSNIVFGIEVNGDARAYPKRILAWHEMFVDEVGGIPLAGVYCTLCGTVILYKTAHKGVNYMMGTSGFLYRSNKLMYDKETQSLWSTLEGEPVIGPLVGKGIKFEYLSVVTTTWGEWKKRHPDTSVLSLNTGHRRDYREGVAYKEYFATDDLMFTIPKIDTSIKNKDEILSIRMPGSKENFAISSKFLRKKPIYTTKIDTIDLVVFTDKTGAHRVYISEGVSFADYDQNGIAIDEEGMQWRISEEGMKNKAGSILKRFQTHNAFWFGYKAAFPNTKLIVK